MRRHAHESWAVDSGDRLDSCRTLPSKHPLWHRHGVGQNVAHEWCGHTPPPHWLSAHLGVAALPQPPKSQLIHAAIVPAQDLMGRNALSFIAVNGDRFRCIQPRIRTRDSWCSGRVACGGRPFALLLAVAGTYTRPQSTRWQSAQGVAARGNCADLRHLRITLDTTRIMQSRAERRGIWI